jgi:predicted DNA-binding protein with PD1-like motif
MRPLALACLFAVSIISAAQAQDAAASQGYMTAPAPKPGMAPGLKATELNPQTRKFQLIFAKGDEVISGLAEFATRNNLTVAHFTALGALSSATIGWFDPDKRAYKTIHLNEEMEVTSLVGNITRGRDGNPVVHVHCVVALLRNGTVYAGHLIEGHISLTMQMYLEDSKPLAAGAGAAP